MAHKKYQQTETTILKWAEKHEGVRIWLSKLNGTKPQRALSLWYFCEWTKKSPEDLLTLKNSFERLDAERLLDQFVMDADYPNTLKWKTTLAVKSFYRCNYRQLQREAGKMDYEQKKPQRNPTKNKRLELFNACFNPRDRALICVTTCSAIALETLSHLRWTHFEEDWQAQDIPHISIPGDLLKGHGKGKYKNVRQETFLTPETKRQLIKYREYMTKRHSVLWTEDTHVFLTIEKPYEPLKYQAIGNAILRISKTARVPFGAHDGRRTVETALENVEHHAIGYRRSKAAKSEAKTHHTANPPLSSSAENTAKPYQN